MLYHELGGLDEYFFAHQEEIDFCWRLQLAGYKVYVQPASVVYHVGGGTLPKGNQLKDFLEFQEQPDHAVQRIYLLAAAIWKIPVRLLLDAVAAWKGLLAGNAGYFMAYCKGTCLFYKMVLFDQEQICFSAVKKGLIAGCVSGVSIVWNIL